MRVISSFANRVVRPPAGRHGNLFPERVGVYGRATGWLLTPLVVLLLAGCEQIAVLDGSKAIETEGKAVGGACRHAGRALEDCYAMNEKASKAAVFSGWREMNDYMTQNKIDTVPPVMARPSGNKGSGQSNERKTEASTDPSRPTNPADKAALANKSGAAAVLLKGSGPGDAAGVAPAEASDPRRSR